MSHRSKPTKTRMTTKKTHGTKETNMQNNLSDLNNHLFATLENLLDDDILKDEKKLNLEIKRTTAITKVSTQILKTAQVQVNAIRTAKELGVLNQRLPALIKTKDSQEEEEKTQQKLWRYIK